MLYDIRASNRPITVWTRARNKNIVIIPQGREQSRPLDMSCLGSMLRTESKQAHRKNNNDTERVKERKGRRGIRDREWKSDRERREMSKRGEEYLWIGDQVMMSIAADSLVCGQRDRVGWSWTCLGHVGCVYLPCGPLDNFLKWFRLSYLVLFAKGCMSHPIRTIAGKRMQCITEGQSTFWKYANSECNITAGTADTASSSQLVSQVGLSKQALTDRQAEEIWMTLWLPR